MIPLSLWNSITVCCCPFKWGTTTMIQVLYTKRITFPTTFPHFPRNSWPTTNISIRIFRNPFQRNGKCREKSKRESYKITSQYWIGCGPYYCLWAVVELYIQRLWCHELNVSCYSCTHNAANERVCIICCRRAAAARCERASSLWKIFLSITAFR